MECSLKYNDSKSYRKSAGFKPCAFAMALVMFFLINALTLRAEGIFEFSPNVESAYQLSLSLRLDEARTQLTYEKSHNPDNLLPLLIEDYIDFFTIFINEDKAEFDRLEYNKERRLKRIRAGNSNSPYYLYTQAEITLHWALARLKFEENITAAREVRRAYKLLEENARKYPDFMANKKTLGLLHAIIGTMPDNYKWVMKMVGMEGTLEQGTSELQEVIAYAEVQPDFLFATETVVMYALLMMHVGNNDLESWQLVHEANIDVENNPLATFIFANIAMHTGHNDEAIRLLENAPRGAQYHKFDYLDYMLGLAKLYRLDTDADVYLQKYVDNFGGQNYIKDAYQKLGWYELLFGSIKGYQTQMLYCRTKGKSIIEDDAKAYLEATQGPLPHHDLIKARLLFDGGYYEKALAVLENKSAKNFDTKRQRVEFSYRIGRIHHKMNQFDQAIHFYQKTIHEGADESWYFACNAALKTGNIHETQNQVAQARLFYQKCLSLYPDEYRNGLHQKAKAGLNRVK